MRKRVSNFGVFLASVSADMKAFEAFAYLRRRIGAFGPSVPVRAYVVALFLLATLPAAVLVSYWIFADIQGERQRVKLELQQSADSLAQVIEHELVSSIEALTILANMDSIRRHNIAAFEKSLRGNRSPLRPNWFSAYLLDNEGNLLFETTSTKAADRRRQAAAPPESGTPAARAVNPSVRISNLVVGHGPEKGAVGAVSIEIPVTIDGKPRYRLGAWIATAVWQDLLQKAGTPAGVFAGIYDREHRLISRTEGSEAFIDEKMPEKLVRSIAAADSGADRRPRNGHDATDDAWKTVALAGWVVEVVDVGRPAGVFDVGFSRAIGVALTAGIACLMFGLLLAVSMARRLASPLRQLARDPRTLANQRLSIREVVQLRDALLAAKALDELAQEAGHLGFFHYRFDTDVLVWTPGLSRLFGMAAVAWESTFEHFLGSIVSEYRERIEASLRHAYAARQEKETLEFRIVLPDGAQRWLSCRIMINYADDGRPEQFSGVGIDVSDRKEAEHGRATLIRREHAARIEAEAANRAKDEFLAMLGHELRNPLSAIAAAIEVLNHVEAGADAALSARGIIARQTHHLAHLMDDLLDVARVISGKILLSRQSINLAPLVDRLVATMRLTGVADRHQVDVALGDVWIDADATRIEQVVNNLLTNALKYTPPGGRIEVRVGGEAGQAVLEVRDTGVGIHPALLPKVFDLFVQAERTLDRRAGGLGIGLTLVRRLVELHGGTVSAASSAAGSVFTVRLPAVDVPLGAAEHTLVPPSRRRRIAVIEDNEDALSTLHMMLELDGHSVWCATDGIGGLASLLEKRPDIAVIDIDLPGLGGLEVAKRSRAAGYAGRMIALSGYSQDGFGKQALAAGFDDYMVKPVNAAHLRRMLAED